MRFHTSVQQSGATATGIPVPDEVIASIGNGKKRFPVVVTIGAYSYRTTVGPYKGQNMLPLSAANRVGAGVAAGDAVEVELTPDDAPRQVATTDDLAAALGDDTAVRAFFDGLSYSHQNAYVTWIESAKKAETRERRVTTAVEMLTEGRTR